MSVPSPTPIKKQHSAGSIAGLVHGIGLIFKGEALFLTEESRESFFFLRRHLVLAAAAMAMATAAGLLGLAFLTLGLGKILEGRYWLSALLLAASFGLLSLGLATYSYRKVARWAARTRAIQEQIKDELAALRHQDRRSA